MAGKQETELSNGHLSSNDRKLSRNDSSQVEKSSKDEDAAEEIEAYEEEGAQRRSSAFSRGTGSSGRRSRFVPKVFGMRAFRDDQLTALQTFGQFVYDKENNTVLSRTPKSWGQIILFYIAFFGFLLLFWITLFQIFLLFVSYEQPRYILDDGIMGGKPGLGFRPNQVKEYAESSIIHLRKGWSGGQPEDREEVKESDTNAGYALRMQEFLHGILNPPQNRSVRCNETDINGDGLDNFRQWGRPPCYYDARRIFGDCATWPYGYADGDLNPCVIVKINRIFGFRPLPLVASDVINDKLYPDMPEYLKKRIMTNDMPSAIYIDCQGLTSADREYLEGNMRYFPSEQSIYLGYFPYQNIGDTASPGLAVKFYNLPENVIVHVQCKLWYNGVVHNEKDLSGLVRFDLLID